MMPDHFPVFDGKLPDPIEGREPYAPPTTVMLSGTRLSAAQWESILTCPASEGTAVARRIVVDYLHIKGNNQDRRTHGHALGGMYLEILSAIVSWNGGGTVDALEDAQVEIQVWVPSQAAADQIEAVVSDWDNDYQADEEVENGRIRLRVADGRMKRFRREMVTGVRKGLDWAVLRE